MRAKQSRVIIFAITLALFYYIVRLANQNGGSEENDDNPFRSGRDSNRRPYIPGTKSNKEIIDGSPGGRGKVTRQRRKDDDYYNPEKVVSGN